jgi:hypothetical protein
MRNKLKLPIDTKDSFIQSSDVSVIGVLSNYYDFTFVARINRFLKYNFYKSKDFSLWKKNKKCNDEFNAYYYNYKEKCCELIIVNTKNTNNDTFISNWKDYNYIIIIVGRDNKSLAEEILKNIKKDVNLANILSLEEVVVLEKVNQVMQMDIFSQVHNIKTTKTKKQGLSLDILEEFFIAIEDYLTNINNDEEKLFFKKTNSIDMSYN